MSTTHSYVVETFARDRVRELVAEADQERLARLAQGNRRTWWHRLIARTAHAEQPANGAASATPVAAGAGQQTP